jgi:diaminopimelate epimerase
MKKYEGAGNSFTILFDEEREISREEFISRFGQKTDGMIFVTQSSQPPYYFQMNFYNRDGSRADFCGNGSRCFLRFLYDNQKVSLGEEILFETGYGLLRGTLIRKDYASVQMPEPSTIEEMQVEGYKGFFLQLGVPHFVTFLDSSMSLENFDLLQESPKIRNNRAFPEGTNVNFVSVVSSSILHVRTFERGVEGETKACGSGSTASAIVYATLLQPPKSTIHVSTNGGLLTVNLENNKIYCSGGVQDV